MSIKEEYILRGPPVGPVPNCSIAEYIWPKLQALPRDREIQVDGDKGNVQTVEDLMRKGVGLSEGLVRLGLGENDVMGMICRNCFDADTVVLASWLSGIPLSPITGGVKSVELIHILKLLQPKIIFCEEMVFDLVSSTIKVMSKPSIVVVMDTTKTNFHPHKTLKDILVDADIDSYVPRPVSSPSENVLGILFSSGSSGLPKGVGITHTNVIFQDFNLIDLLNPKKLITCVQISQFYWVTGYLMFFRSLTRGMKRILVRDTTEINVLTAIQRFKPDWTLMAPIIAMYLVDYPDFDKFEVSSVEKLLLGGSPLTQAMINKITYKWPSAKITNAYGTTETTGCITSNLEGKVLISVGKVTPGMEVKVVDLKTGKSVKENIEGEICARSPGVMKGYVGNEEATRQTVDKEGWCHTGDIGYYDEEGQFFIVDRLKEMLKIRNMQVAPVEVEDVILEIPGVAGAAVTAVTPDGNISELVALVEKNANSKLTEEDIRTHVAETLSDYKKLTGGVYFVDSVPKTDTGKLRRREVNKMAQALYSKCR